MVIGGISREMCSFIPVDFSECLEQYNDLGDGISGVIASSYEMYHQRLSQDEKNFLVVGNDGVVVI